MVIETAPGEEAQVDYGTGPMVRDPHSGKYRRTRLFVLTLGYSRKSVRLLVFRSSSQIWAELHEKAFRRLGGVTRVVVLDNLREGVLTPDIYDPTLNPLYRDVLTHYGAVALPCRVRDPDRKGKVESGVGHAQKTPLKGLRFESLEEAQAYLDHWEERWADTRIHGTTKRQVAAMFAEEKPALLPLPVEPFRYYQYGERTVHLDGCVEVEAAYYGAPPGWIGRRVQVQWDRPAGPPAGPADRPAAARTLAPAARRPSHQRRGPPQANAAGHAAAAAAAPTRPGSHIGALCRGMHREQGRNRGAPHPGRAVAGQEVWRRQRSRRPAPSPWKWASANTASCAAIWSGSPQLPLSLRQVDPLIRQLTLYRDFIRKQNQGERTMNLIELQRALRQLRLGGMAAVLETRLRQAQAEAMAPIDLISCLVSDELTRRSDRLLERRRKQAAFRDPHKTLDNFDFTFNPKMNRSLVFDLATCAFIGKREDALVSRPRRHGQESLGAGHRPGRHSAGLPRAVPRNACPAG